MLTTLRNRPDRRRGALRSAGFTLAEILIAATIGSMVMTAVLSSFLMMGRSGTNAYEYVGMEQESRKGLERFGEDVRMSTNVGWPAATDTMSSTDVTLKVMHQNDSGTDSIRYYWDTTSGSSTYHCLIRSGIDPITGVNTTTTLVHDVQTFEFDYWMLGSTGAATNAAGTKQLQIRLTLRKQAKTTVAATNLVVSARFVLRNKL